MFGALKRGRFRSLASLILVVNVVGELQQKRTLAASRGFLAAARLSCFIFLLKFFNGYGRSNYGVVSHNTIQYNKFYWHQTCIKQNNGIYNSISRLNQTNKYVLGQVALRHAALSDSTDYRVLQKRSTFANAMYSPICVEWFDVNRSNFDEDNYARKMILTFSFPVTLTVDLLTSNLLP